MPIAEGLHYELHGPEDGVPLLLSPGIGGIGGCWAPNLPVLAVGHRVICYDHRGTGASARTCPERMGVADSVDDLLLLIDRLGIDRAHVLGHGAGGVAGLALALRAPERVRSLALVNAWARPDPHVTRCAELLCMLLADGGPAAYLHAEPLLLYPATWISAHADRVAAEEARRRCGFPEPEAMVARLTALAAFDIADRLAEIRLPVLALAAADDMLVPSICSEAIAQGIKGAELTTMPWGGHACNITHPNRFDRILLDWFASASAG